MSSRRIAFVHSRIAELIPLIRQQYPEVRMVEVDEAEDGLTELIDSVSTDPGATAIEFSPHSGPGLLQMVQSCYVADCGHPLRHQHSYFVLRRRWVCWGRGRAGGDADDQARSVCGDFLSGGVKKSCRKINYRLA